MATYRILCFLALCICLVFIAYYPWTAFFLIPLWIAFAMLLWRVAMRPVSEPNRAVVFRLETFHHVAKSGYVFLIPGFDRIHEQFSVAERLLKLENVPGFATADGAKPRCNLELFWKVRNDVEGRVTDKVREMVLMEEEHRAKIVEHTIIVMARQLALSYMSDQLNDQRVREGFCSTLRQAANEILTSYGLTIERVFWRGSLTPEDVLKRQVANMVVELEVDSMVKAIKKIREELGETVSAEDLYTMYEYINLMKHKGTTPFQPGNKP